MLPKKNRSRSTSCAARSAALQWTLWSQSWHGCQWGSIRSPCVRDSVVKLRSVLSGRVSTSRRWFVASAAAVVIAAVGVTAALLPLRRDAVRLNALIAMRDSQLATLRDTLAVMRESSRVLQTAITVDGRHGGLVIFADDRHRRWQVVMHGLPPAPSGQAYQFWFICDDGMIRDATLVGDPNRPALYTLVLPPNSGRVRGASLTLEPANDASTSPKGRELAHLLL